MRAVSLIQPGHAAFVDIPEPTVGPEDVLIEPRYVGLYRQERPRGAGSSSGGGNGNRFALLPLRLLLRLPYRSDECSPVQPYVGRPAGWGTNRAHRCAFHQGLRQQHALAPRVGARGTAERGVSCRQSRADRRNGHGAGVRLRCDWPGRRCRRGTDDLKAVVAAITDGEGPNVVVEAAGTPTTCRQAVELAAFAGRVVCIGYAKEDIAWPSKLIVSKELDLFGSRNAIYVFPGVIRMLERRTQPFAEMISSVEPVDNVPQVLQQWDASPEQFTKILIEIA